MENVQDGILRPLGSREIQRTKKVEGFFLTPFIFKATPSEKNILVHNINKSTFINGPRKQFVSKIAIFSFFGPMIWFPEAKT